MSLIAWYPLTNGIKKNIVSGDTLEGTGVTQISSGKIGSTYSFDGSSGSCLRSSVPKNINSQTFSAAMWIKLSSTWAGWGQALTIGQPGTSWNDIRFGIDIDTSRIAYFTISSGSQALAQGGPYQQLPVNQWCHIVVVKSDSTCSMFVNGQPASGRAVATTSIVPVLDASSILSIGGNGSNSTWECGECDISDVRIYNHALSTKEIKELGRAMVLHYDFNTPLFEDATNITNNSAAWSSYTEYWHVTAYTSTGVKLVRPSGSISACLALSNSSFTNAIQVGTTWTFSCFLYKNGRPWKANCQSCEPSYGYSNITWESHDNGYYRCTFTNSFAHSHTNWVIHNYLFGDAAVGEECEMRYIQLEKSDHASPYTDSTRSGMIVDCSGLGNDAMLKNPSYYKFMRDSACGSGSLHSAGDPGAYIKTALVPNFIQGTGTICLWYKKDANAFNYNNGDFLIATQHSAGYYFGATNSTSVWHSGATHSKFYIDGVERSSGGITDTNWHFYVFTGVNLSSWNTFALHCHGDDSWLYRGQIGDFRIYNTNLTEEDINELYHTSWQSNQIGASFVRSVSEGSGTVKMPKNGDVNCKVIYETGILPVEYEALDGLYFDRGPCINTGVTINDATKPIKVAVDITAKHVSANSCVLGCGNALWRGPVMLNCCRYYLEAGVDGYGSDVTVPEGVYEDGERFVYHADIQPSHQTFYKNGTPIQNIPSRALITSTYPIYIGGFNAPSGLITSDNFLGWIHYVEIEYDTIRRQMVPCKRRSDGVLGMYDMVGGQFYTAATTGAWTKGSSTVSQNRAGCLCVGEIHEC